MRLVHLAAAGLLLATSSSYAASFAALDTTFGTNGVAGNGDGAFAIATDSMDRIYALMPAHPDRIIARFTADGALDTTFGGDGFVTIAAFAPAMNSGNATLVDIAYDDTSDTLLVGGYVLLQGGQTAMTIGRYDTAGNRVTTFDGDGFVVLTAANDAFLYAIDVLDDGTIVGGGEYWASDSGSIVRDAVAVRVAVDGAPDAAFGTAGIKTVDFGAACEVVRSVTQDDSGRMWLGIDVGATCQSVQASVARLLADGAPDAAFSTDGAASLDVAAYSGARLLVAQADGGVVALTVRQDGEFGEPEQMTVTRLGADGASASSVSAGYPAGTGHIRSRSRFALQSGGRLVGAGVVDPNERLALYRLAGCEQLTPTGGACDGGGGGGGGGGALSLGMLGVLLLGLRRRR